MQRDSALYPMIFSMASARVWTFNFLKRLAICTCTVLGEMFRLAAISLSDFCCSMPLSTSRSRPVQRPAIVLFAQVGEVLQHGFFRPRTKRQRPGHGLFEGRHNILRRGGFKQAPASSRHQAIAERFRIQVRGKHNNGQFRHRQFQPLRTFNPLDARHQDIHDHGLGWCLGNVVQGVGGVVVTIQNPAL